MFSPMVAIASVIARSTVISPTFAALIFSTSAPTFSATWAIILTSPWNCSLRATKSVSEFTSTTTPLMPAVTAPIRPSAAMRPAFLAAFERPFLRSQSIAASMSPLFSDSACLQSIMPTPVVSRRSLTIAAVIVAIVLSSACQDERGEGLKASPLPAIRICLSELKTGGRIVPATTRFALFRFRRHRLGLGDPAIGTGRQTDLFANLVRGIVIEFGQLPVMEDAEVVELLLDRAGHAGEFFQIVGSTSRAGETLESDGLRSLRNCFANGMRRGTD